MTTWYTSDLHFGHERILELSHRPFSTLQQMHDTLVYRWNERVAPSDVVWVLGDVAMNRAGLFQVARLNGTKVLVAGNHDSCWEYHRRWARHVRTYMEAGFSLIHTEGHAVQYRLGAGGPVVNLAHLPYRGAGDHTVTERYSEARLTDDGTALLCGHVHDAWRSRSGPSGSVMINVGVDVWDYAPVSAETLATALKGACGERAK